MTSFDISNLVPPPDAKDAFETAHVEGLQSLYVTTIWGPCLATIQPCRWLCRLRLWSLLQGYDLIDRKQVNRALSAVELCCKSPQQIELVEFGFRQVGDLSWRCSQSQRTVVSHDDYVM